MNEEKLMGMLLVAYRKARLGKRRTLDEQRFEVDLLVNLAALCDEILNQTYRPSRGIAFITRKPVIREIFAAPFRDRVVHHLIYDMVAEWWDRRFIHDNYSCRVGKGTLFGVRRLQHHVMGVLGERVSGGCGSLGVGGGGFSGGGGVLGVGEDCGEVLGENGGEAWVLKLDIEGYFMSLPRQKLYERAVWGLERQFGRDAWEYEMLEFLWREVIFDDPTWGVKRRGGLEDWRDLPDSKSLFCARPGCGVVIGNLTSQLLSNIYLDQLDRYVMYELGFKRYGRYVDDFYLVAAEREKLMAVVPLIERYLLGIGLRLHPRKRFLQECSRGVPFLGAVVYPYRLLAGRRIRVNFRAAGRVYASAGLVRGDDVVWSEGLTAEAVSLASYRGITMHYRHWRLWHG